MYPDVITAINCSKLQFITTYLISVTYLLDLLLRIQIYCYLHKFLATYWDELDFNYNATLDIITLTKL